MLDIGWTELLVVSVILIVVVGPKDLPPMLRAFGKMTTRLRKTAGEFRAQFDEALRESELDDIRNTVNDVKKLNPAESLREAINPLRQMGQDIKSDLQKVTRVDSPVESGDRPDNSILPEISNLASEPPAELRPPAPVSAPGQTAQAPATSAPASTAGPVGGEQTPAAASASTKAAMSAETVGEGKKPVARKAAPRKAATASDPEKDAVAKTAKSKTAASASTGAAKVAASRPQAEPTKPKSTAPKSTAPKSKATAPKAKTVKTDGAAKNTSASPTGTRKAKSEDRA